MEPFKTTGDLDSAFEDFDSLLSCLAFDFFSAASLALFAFFSFRYCTRGVVVTFSDPASAESTPLVLGFVIGSVKLCRKSMNS